MIKNDYHDYIEKIKLSNERKEKALEQIKTKIKECSYEGNGSIMIYKPQKVKGGTKFRVKALSVAVAFAVVAVALIVSLCVYFIKPNTNIIPSQPSQPDSARRFLINEHCSAVNADDKAYDIVFTNLYLTDTIIVDDEDIKLSSGGYLLLTGQIEAPDFALITEDIDLELTIKKPTDDRIQFVQFEKELSVYLSQADLYFDDETGDMSGDFCLVFSIDENNYALIESKTTQTSLDNDTGPQIELYSNINWGGEGLTVFRFYCADVENVLSF